MPPEATLNRRSANRCRSSIGSRAVVSRHEQREGERGGTERGEGARIAPAVRRRLDDGVHEGSDPGDRQHRAGHVQRMAVGIARRRHQPDAGHEGGHHQGDVHEEDRSPPEVLEQQARTGRAEGGGARGHAGPRRDGPAPLLGREDARQDRQGRRHHERRRHPHHPATGDHHGRRRGGGRHGRPDQEEPEPGLQRALRPKRSPSVPAVNRRPAKTSAYESTIHCSALVDAPRSRAIAGRARFRLMLATITTVRLRHSTPSVVQRRAYAAGSMPPRSTPSGGRAGRGWREGRGRSAHGGT